MIHGKSSVLFGYAFAEFLPLSNWGFSCCCVLSLSLHCGLQQSPPILLPVCQTPTLTYHPHPMMIAKRLPSALLVFPVPPLMILEQHLRFVLLLPMIMHQVTLHHNLATTLQMMLLLLCKIQQSLQADANVQSKAFHGIIPATGMKVIIPVRKGKNCAGNAKNG